MNRFKSDAPCLISMLFPLHIQPFYLSHAGCGRGYIENNRQNPESENFQCSWERQVSLSSGPQTWLSVSKETNDIIRLFF